MPRFTVFGLFLVIVASAGVFAALRASNGYWAGGVQMGTMARIGGAGLRSIQGRAGWLGFLVFCGGYFVAVRSLSEREVASLPTTILLERVQGWVLSPVLYGGFSGMTYTTSAVTPVPPPPPPPTATFVATTINAPPSITWTSGPTPMWLPTFEAVANPESFRNIGHNLFALLFGGVAAWFARRSQARQVIGQAGSIQGS